jgi:hypothetical protein
LVGLGHAMQALRRTAEADAAFRRALEIRRAALPRGDRRIVEVLGLLAALHEEQGSAAAAARFTEAKAQEAAAADSAAR